MRGVCGAKERRGAAHLRNETWIAATWQQHTRLAVGEGCSGSRRGGAPVGLRARSMGLVKACRQLGQTRRLAHRFLEDDHIAGNALETLEENTRGGHARQDRFGRGLVAIMVREGWKGRGG